MSAPQWASIDDDTANLLTVLADPSPLPNAVEYEWELFVACLKGVGAGAGWIIDPNTLRQAIAGRIKAQRVGAFTHRALSQGLVTYTGRYVTSTDTKGRNSGKPSRELRWLG